MLGHLDHSGGRVLLVDDDVFFCGAYSKLLTRGGFEVRVEQDLDGALEALDSWPFDVALVDLTLAGGGGLGFVNEARRREMVAPVIVMTGGTGLTSRDVTPEAIGPIAEKQIVGFGELFRWLSYKDIGSSTIQSRADAWIVGRALVFALPGSNGACRLGMDQILREQLDSRHGPCNFANLLPRIRGEK